MDLVSSIGVFLIAAFVGMLLGYHALKSSLRDSGYIIVYNPTFRKWRVYRLEELEKLEKERR